MNKNKYWFAKARRDSEDRYAYLPIRWEGWAAALFFGATVYAMAISIGLLVLTFADINLSPTLVTPAALLVSFLVCARIWKSALSGRFDVDHSIKDYVNGVLLWKE